MIAPGCGPSLLDTRVSLATAAPQYTLGPAKTYYQKNPRVRKIRVRNSGAGNGCANFMDACKKCVLSAGKTMSIKFLVLGRGGIWGFFGGGECRFYFCGRADFSEPMQSKPGVVTDN